MFQILTKLLINKYKFAKNRTFIWSSKSKNFVNIKNFKSIPSKLLLGIEYQKKIVFENTKKFMDGYKSNNVLLWGSRGSGKSTLIKSCFNELSKNNNLKLIQINKENLKDIMLIYDFLEKQELLRFIIFIDDLSFETNDSEYKKIGTEPGFYEDWQAGNDPAGITTQNDQLSNRLDPVLAGKKLANYLNVLSLEAQTLARACGKSHIRNLEPEDLNALTVEASAMARVPLAGTDWIPSNK